MVPSTVVPSPRSTSGVFLRAARPGSHWHMASGRGVASHEMLILFSQCSLLYRPGGVYLRLLWPNILEFIGLRASERWWVYSLQCVHRRVTGSSGCNVHVDGFTFISSLGSGINLPNKRCLIAKYELGSFPAGTSGKEPACQCRRCKRRGFDLWVGKIPLRRSWQPTPVFLPGKPHGQRSLVGYRPWGWKELDKTEVT